MNKNKIMGLMGYTFSDVTFEPMDILIEIKTGGTDSGGFENAQTIGIATNEYNNYCLYTGSIRENFPLNRCSTIVLGDGITQQKIPNLLRKLADELESINFQSNLLPYDLSKSN